MKQDAIILICCHKPYDCLVEDNFLPIQVGKSHSAIDIGIIGDNTGDNISDKNGSYCELTAIYWFWKNRVVPKYVGLYHYRRYFMFDNAVTLPDLDKLFMTCDIVMAKRLVFPASVKFFYNLDHIPEDSEILRSVVYASYPDYAEAFDHVMLGNKLSPYNMFIMPRNCFNEYASWLFSILSEVEKKVKISQYPYQARVFGFMGERLLNVYAYKNHLRVKYVPVLQLEETQPARVKQIVRNGLNNLIFTVIRIYHWLNKIL